MENPAEDGFLWGVRAVSHFNASSEEKFRKVKLANAKISHRPSFLAKKGKNKNDSAPEGKALSSPGAEDLLVAAGFVKTGEHLEEGSCPEER